ncbi:MAG: CpsB/CapC family capsule biosynthesis tyrosine phosphatase, partial [Bacteroidota bacterium]
FEHILNQDEVLKLGQNHLLIEMSYYQPSINFEPAVDKIKSKQLFPVLAHPERYLFLHKQQGKYNYYKSLGITFQLNMLSLSGYYGPDVKKMALKLVKQKQIDFIASDVHNLSHLASLRDNLTIPKDILPVLNAIIDRTISTFY